jgi:hypothetical protein
LAHRGQRAKLQVKASVRSSGAVQRGEVRAAVTDEEPEVPEPVAEVEGHAAGLLSRPLADGVGGDAEVHPAGQGSLASMKRQDSAYGEFWHGTG